MAMTERHEGSRFGECCKGTGRDAGDSVITILLDDRSYETKGWSLFHWPVKCTDFAFPTEEGTSQNVLFTLSGSCDARGPSCSMSIFQYVEPGAN